MGQCTMPWRPSLLAVVMWDDPPRLKKFSTQIGRSVPRGRSCRLEAEPPFRAPPSLRSGDARFATGPTLLKALAQCSWVKS